MISIGPWPICAAVLETGLNCTGQYRTDWPDWTVPIVVTKEYNGCASLTLSEAGNFNDIEAIEAIELLKLLELSELSKLSDSVLDSYRSYRSYRVSEPIGQLSELSE